MQEEEMKIDGGGGGGGGEAKTQQIMWTDRYMDGWGYIYIYNIKELGLISFVFLTEVSLAQQLVRAMLLSKH